MRKCKPSGDAVHTMKNRYASVQNYSSSTTEYTHAYLIFSASLLEDLLGYVISFAVIFAPSI